MFLSATALLTGCGNDDFNENGNANANENAISFSTNLQPFAKASTYSSVTDMQTEGSFTCTTYEANSTTVSIPASRVVWSGIDWQFADDIYFWPISGDLLDFFAYMPAEKPAYISSISYGTYPSAPQFVCSGLPLAEAGQDGLKEFIWALSTGKNKSNSSAGVEMAFKHVFARVKFVVGNPASDNVTINSVTIPDIYSSGTCTWPNTWSSWGGADSFVAGGDESWYLVIPNNYGSKTLTVNATWKNWSEVSQSKSKDITVNWEAGHSYTYTITLDENGLIIDTEKYTEQW